MISCLKNDCAINLRDPIPLTTKAHLRKTLTSKLLIEFAPNENTSSEARNLRRGVFVSLTLQSFAKRSTDKAVTRLIYLLSCFFVFIEELHFTSSEESLSFFHITVPLRTRKRIQTEIELDQSTKNL